MTTGSLTLSSVLSSLLLTTACGVTAPTDEHDGRPEVTGAFATEVEPAADTDDAPRAEALRDLTIDDHAGLADLIRGTRAFAVSEQRFVSPSDAPVVLHLELLPPRGSFGRTVTSVLVRAPDPHAERVLCETDRIATYDPRCETRVPTPSSDAVTGPLTAGTWSLAVIEEATNLPVSSCTANDRAMTLSCTLPAQRGAAYRIVTSVAGLTDLWTGRDVSVLSANGRTITGTVDAAAYQCWDWSVASGGRVYCETRYDFTGFASLERAWIQLDPITVEVDADGVIDAVTSAPIAWTAEPALLPIASTAELPRSRD